MTLNSTAPAGISVIYNPKSPVLLPGDKPLNVTLIVSAASSVALGNYTVSVKGTSGTNSQSASFTLRVLQYRIVMTQNQFLPGTLNVTVGSTIYWQNLDGPAGGCAAPGASSGNGQHNVVFTTLPAANSSTINQFQIYSYTFTTPGNYFYYSSLDTDHLMNGTINVLAANGGGVMAPVAIPAFSYLEGGASTPESLSSIAATTATTTATNPYGVDSASPTVGSGFALAGLDLFNAHSLDMSGVGFGTLLAVLLVVAALGTVATLSATARRGLTLLIAGIVHSDASR